jgi:hypothetical protein
MQRVFFCRFRKGLSLLVIMFLTLNLSGCLVMFSKGQAPLPTSENNTEKRSSSKYADIRRPHVYAMRGWLGIFSKGMDELAQKVEKQLGFSSESMSYHEKNRLIKHLVYEYKMGRLRGGIVLVGHSFGADAQVDVAKALSRYNIPVRLLIAVEPTRKEIIPPNVKQVYQLASGTSGPKRLLGWGMPYEITDTNTLVERLDVARGPETKGMHHFNMTTHPKTLEIELDLIKNAFKSVKSQTKEKARV